MQSRWAIGCVLLLTSLSMGCGQTNVTPPPTALAPVPTSTPATPEIVIVPVKHEVVTDGARVRVHLTVIEFSGSLPFPADAPDLWQSSENSRVVNSDEVSTLIDSWENVGSARRRTKQSVETSSGQAANFEMEYLGGCKVTPVVGPDGIIQFEAIPSRYSENESTTDLKAATTELRQNESLMIAGPTSVGTVTEISRYPILGDIPMIGPVLFSTKKRTAVTNRTLYLVSCEVISQ